MPPSPKNTTTLTNLTCSLASRTQKAEGKLKLMHFRRVKQLGAGDVGLVDLVQLQVRRGSRGCVSCRRVG